MADRPTITTLSSGARYDTSQLNTNFQAIRDHFDLMLGRNGTSGDNNIWTGDSDAGDFDLLNVGRIDCTSLSLNGVVVSGIDTSSGDVPAPTNPGEDGYVLTASGGSWAWAAAAASSSLVSTDAGAAEGPVYTLERDSVSPAASDIIGAMHFQGKDDGGNDTVYAKVNGHIVDPTDTSEDGGLNFWGMVAGTITKIFYTGLGVVIGSPTGTDKGAGTINAEAVYENGSRVSVAGLTDEWVPAGAMLPLVTNGASSNLTETTTNKIIHRTYDFDKDTDEMVQFSVMLPQSWDAGVITASFAWRSTGAGDVVWGIQATSVSDDEVFDNAFGTAVTVTDTLTATTDIMITADTGDMTVAGIPAKGDLVFFQVYRDANNAADTLDADARLLGVKITYTADAGNDA